MLPGIKRINYVWTTAAADQLLRLMCKLITLLKFVCLVCMLGTTYCVFGGGCVCECFEWVFGHVEEYYSIVLY